MPSMSNQDSLSKPHKGIQLGTLLKDLVPLFMGDTTANRRLQGIVAWQAKKKEESTPHLPIHLVKRVPLIIKPEIIAAQDTRKTKIPPCQRSVE